jgi:16S rRNA (guanine966-N2)-methyltransferase
MRFLSIKSEASEAADKMSYPSTFNAFLLNTFEPMRKKPQAKKSGEHPRRSNSVRIIAGIWRGRKLRFPSANTLRPTPDRVRETLFNWLAADIAGATCLDLFSGSGALGFEALSRGAQSVTMIDRAPEACEQLKTNASLLGIENHTEIITSDALAWLKSQPARHFDIIFLDPPYHQEMIAPCIDLLNKQGCLQANCWIYLESAVDEKFPEMPGNWNLHRQKRAGLVNYCLYRCLDPA